MHRTTFGTLAVALAFGLAALGCQGRNGEYAGDTMATAAPGTGATATAGGDVATATGTTRIGDIVDHTDQYLGDTVTIEADVEEVLSPFAFSLDEDDALAGGIDNDLLVFSPKSAQLEDIDDQWMNNKVRVTGVVQQKSVAELEKDLDRDLDPNLESKVKGSRPVLIAHSVQRVGR